MIANFTQPPINQLMKNYLFIVFTILALLTYSCDCNKADVPEEVKSTFSTMFPNASDIEWEMDDDMWEVEFEWNNMEYEASFNPDGSWDETEFEMEKSELHEMALFILSNDYPDWEIEEVEFVESSDFRGYEVGIEMDEKKMEILFNEGGELVAIEEEEDDDDDD